MHGLFQWDAAVPLDDQELARRKALNATGAGVDQINREVIDQMFPPRDYEEDGLKYRRYASISPVAKSDVQKMQLDMQQKLVTLKARMKGVCSIRAEIYGEAFDEIIRQVTIDCNARGALLLKVRDHYRKTVESHRELLDAALDWTSRKQIQINLDVPELQDINRGLKSRKRDLVLRVNDLQLKLDAQEKRIQETRQLREKDHGDEIAFLKRLGQMLKSQIDMAAAQK